MRDAATADARLVEPARLGVTTRLGWPLAVVATVVLANLPPLLGIVNVNPLVPTGATGRVNRLGYLPGAAFLDQYAGWTSQALGHLAAIDWLHGTVPWWNPFEGLGAPLLAEMQSAAFFPPTLLLALPQGQLYFHMTLECIAGLATWFLLRELGFSHGIATVGGILFALNGTFAWLTANSENPVAFLPVMILGIERLSRRESFDTAGFLLLAGGLAMSIYAGAPETAYFEALFALLWYLFRVVASPSGGRWRFSVRIALGGGIGLMVALPLLIAFVNYLPIAYLGPNRGGFALTHIPRAGIATIGLPYLLGPIKAFEPTLALRTTWVDVGGFVTAPVLALAFVGLVGGGRDRGMRCLLAGTIGVLLLWSFGFRAVQTVLQHLPAVRDVEFFRYAPPVWELTFVLLACFGVERVARREGRGRRLAIASGGVAALCAVAGDLVLTRPTITFLDRYASYHAYPVTSVIWAVGIVVAVTAVGLVGGRGGSGKHFRGTATAAHAGRHRAAVGIVAALLVVDALVMFVVPELSGPRSVTLDTGPADYLAAHLGNGRFFSILDYLPNYGAYFGLASADANDVPLPKLWTQYVPAHLAPGTKVTYLFGRAYGNGVYGVEGIVHHLLERLSDYEAIDVRYVLAPNQLNVFGHGPVFSDGVTRVYEDSEMTIYALPRPRPFFSTSGAPCQTTSASRELAVVRCTGPATLLRAELDLPGWSATVDGRPAHLALVDGGLTAVQLPAGTSTVAFSYLPPHEGIALGVFVLGLLGAVALPLLGARRRRRLGGTGDSATTSVTATQ
jgi:hypothetical protein